MSDQPKMMKVFSLTDLSSPELEAAGMVGATLAVHHTLLGPGESAEVPDDDLVRRAIQGYVQHRALSVGQLPPDYAVRKARLKAEADAAAASQESAQKKAKRAE